MLLFDIETDGFLEYLTTIHTMTIYDTDTDTFTRYDKEDTYLGVQRLDGAEICGHNVIGFDVPAIQKLYPDFRPAKVMDTLVWARLAWADVKLADGQRMGFPRKLIGSHGLKAYGYRLKILKGEFGETADWSKWTQEMSDYCEQDVVVTKALYEKLLEKDLDPRSIELEHQVQEIVQRQVRFGFDFDEAGAQELYAELLDARQESKLELMSAIKPWFAKKSLFVPKKDDKKKGYTAGCPMTHLQTVVFNPGSRDHITRLFSVKYGWKPTVFTDTGKPQIDETILSKLPYPEAKPLTKYFLIEKRIGQLAEGKQAWLKTLGKDLRIHGGVNSNGAVTGRMTHSSPNVAQVPSVRAPYGEQCRALFRVPLGYKLVGCDASGLELRCLAHYMARYDEGKYVDVVLNGDIHSVNQDAAGLPTRDNAKTFIYAFLYGAGDEKLGSIIGKGRQAGSKLKQKFFKATPAVKKLIDAVQSRAESEGFLVGLDGRKLSIRSSHAALNTLLQSAGALVMKQYLVFLDEALQNRGFLNSYTGKGRRIDYEFVANIHDEVQLQVREEIATEVAVICEEVFAKVTAHFNFRCRLDGQAKIGNNWKETH